MPLTQPFNSARLHFRPLREDDAVGMFELDRDPAVHRYLGQHPVTDIAQSRAIIRFIQAQYVAHGMGRWAVLLRATDEFMGWAGLKKVAGPLNGQSDFYELGYRYIPRYWGQGYGYEAAQAWLNYGFETLNLPRVCAYADAENAGSRRILEKVGLKPGNKFGEAGIRHVWYEASNPQQR